MQLRESSVCPHTQTMPHNLQWTRCHVSLPFLQYRELFFSLPNVNITQNKGRSGLGPSNADYRAPFVTE